MKKNIIIIALVFILPVIAYAIMSKGHTVEAAKIVEGQPQVIKFSSKLCSDCQKLKVCFDELKPNYQDRISIIEYDIENNDKNVNEAIDKYNITLVPTVIFIDKNGNQKHKTEGFVKKEKLDSYFKDLLK